MSYSFTKPASATQPVNKSAQRPLLRVIGNDGGNYYWIRKGKQGSLQTAAQMARLVREDTVRDEGLQKFAAQILINAGLDSHAPKRDTIAAIFRYVKQIRYIHDPAGSFDSIQNARSTIAKGFGDCDDLSVLLATLLAQIGLSPRFVLARYKTKSKGYDHVYVDVDLPVKEGGRVALDPSANRRGAGWESLKSIERLTYPIFAGQVTTLGDAMNLALTGAQVGASFIPVVGGLVSSLIGPVAGLFSRTQQKTEEQARDSFKDQVYQGLAQIQAEVDACRMTPAAGRAAGRQLIDQMYAACDKFTKASVAQSCRNFETQDRPGGAQQGAFATRLSKITQGGASCSVAGSPGAPSGGNAASVGTAQGASAGLAANLPTLLLIAGGIYLVMKVWK